MANLTRFDPFANLARFDPLHDMDELMRDFRLVPSWRGVEAEPRIRMDIQETDQAFMLKAELPGVKKEDIKVAIEGNEVSVKAEVREEKEQKEGNTLCSERYYGQQYRSFTLPQDVDETKAEAKYNDGILELTLPKKPGTAKKQLTIQ